MVKSCGYCPETRTFGTIWPGFAMPIETVDVKEAMVIQKSACGSTSVRPAFDMFQVGSCPALLCPSITAALPPKSAAVGAATDAIVSGRTNSRPTLSWKYGVLRRFPRLTRRPAHKLSSQMVD